MYLIITARRLKPGSYDDFRRDWEPDVWPERIRSARLARNTDDPDEVVAYAVFDGTLDDLDALRDDPAFLRTEEARMRRIAQHEQAVLVNSIYEIVEEIEP